MTVRIDWLVWCGESSSCELESVGWAWDRRDRCSAWEVDGECFDDGDDCERAS